GVVHQDVDAPELMDRAFDARGYGRGARDVGLDHERAHADLAELSREGVEIRSRAGRSDDDGAFASERERTRPSDTAPRTRNEGYLILETHDRPPRGSYTRSAFAMRSTNASRKGSMRPLRMRRTSPSVWPVRRSRTPRERHRS